MPALPQDYSKRDYNSPVSPNLDTLLSYLEGHIYTSISSLQRVPYSTVRDIVVRRLNSQDNTFKSKPRPGCIKKTTSRDNHVLVHHTLQYPRTTLQVLSTLSKSTKRLYYNTVRTILKHTGKAKRKPRRKLYLSPIYIKRRLEWCKYELKGKRD